MEIKKVSQNNFGLKINDNMTLQMIQHFWQKRFNSQEVIRAFQKIKNSAPDTFELSFNEFLTGTPSEVVIIKSQQGMEKFSVLFAEVKKGRPQKGSEGRTILALSPSAVAQTIVDKVAELAKNAGSQRQIKNELSIARDGAFGQLMEYWEKRASKEEIKEALEKISSSADNSYRLNFKNFVYENPRTILISKGAEHPYKIELPVSKKIVVRGRKPKIPREAMSPAETAEIISAKIKEYLQNGFVAPAKRGGFRGIKKRNSQVEKPPYEYVVIQDGVPVIKRRRGRPPKNYKPVNVDIMA